MKTFLIVTKKLLFYPVTFVAVIGFFCLGPIGTAETLADFVEGTRPFSITLPWIIYFGLSTWWLIHISHTNTSRHGGAEQPHPSSKE